MNQTLCTAAEISVLDTSYNIIRAFHLLFGTTVLILIVRIIWSYRTKSLKLHTNLIVLVGNLLFLYAIFVMSQLGTSVMYFTILFTYKNSCDCLIEAWVVYLLRIPFYLYVAGSPLFHFAIMLERVFATIFVKIYENRGKMIGIIITIIVWALSALFALYVYLSSIIDAQTFSHPMAYITLTSIYNAQFLIDFHSFYLVLVIFIAIADYFLFHHNKKIKSNFAVTTYNLSQNYQAKQNILVMKIIFPLDFSYSFVFAIYNFLSSYIRARRPETGQLIYIRAIDAITLLIVLHAMITLIVYDYFLKKQNDINKNFIKKNSAMSTDIYFKKLNYAWK
uniref:Uncharacterized protein n=1 Tax=Meloidogyne enterolobii TaxID=390850 RepID=A0A6V7TYS3_MELEN|nr:unnamed protein product [Meloidogyne enterolobii]